ncbi:MAG: nucleoside hydrolase [Alphaproteobacteria bacterium]|nr:nucleoside hydrolase [Alphaproteobacteria bacterium]
MARTRIVIDTDPGQDDAVAILLALAERERLDLLGLTTVAGNVPVELTTANALRLVELAGRADLPVFRGASRPLLRTLKTAEFICGPDGLEGAGLPPPKGKPRDAHAVAFLLDTLRAAAPKSLTLCPLGPLTNIALALAQEPALAARIERIVLMGGARDLGNVTPAAEFNFYVDPHAAQIVLQSGVPIVMFGLNATHQAMATPERVGLIAALDSAVARAVTGMLERPRPGGKAKFGVEGHPLHDPCVIAFLLWPELFTGRDCHVAVETAGETTIGRSAIDWWGSQKLPANARVIDRIDDAEMFKRLARSLAKLG